MITLQHSLVYLSALAKDGKVDLEKFRKDIPWVLLPDAIRCYSGNREYSHFEIAPDSGEISWIEFPEDLKNLSKESMQEHMWLATGIKKAVIGEQTCIDKYCMTNQTHSKYAQIRAHLEQDVILDRVVRELVDCSQKYDDVFVVNATGETIDGQELRRRVASFEKYGFLYFAKKVYEETGIFPDQKWFDENVRKSLEDTYSEYMSENTYKYMKIDPEIAERMAKGDFELRESDIKEIGLGENIEEVFEQMYQEAVERTRDVSLAEHSLSDDAPKTTEEWEAKIARLKSENQQLLEEYRELHSKYRKLWCINNALRGKVKRLQEMLKSTLGFCETVKRSSFGRFFFGDKIDELTQEGKDLSEEQEKDC